MYLVQRRNSLQILRLRTKALTSSYSPAFIFFHQTLIWALQDQLLVTEISQKVLAKRMSSVSTTDTTQLLLIYLFVPTCFEVSEPDLY